MYTVSYFIEKFKSIPEEKWAVGQRHGPNDTHCDHGWCDIKDTQDAEEEYALIKLAIDYIGETGFAFINNGTDYRYNQPTPKQRILAALLDIKKMQYPELSNTTVEDLLVCKEDCGVK